VKFPRTRDGVDRRILEVEAAYHRVAKAFGARTFGDVTWAEDCLFVPRFDRLREGNKVTYLGMESLCSLAGVSEYGVPVAKETLAQAVALYTTDPTQELKEFLLRDVLDVALGNTDNHARNTAVLKMPDGRIELSPLYDLAPMVLDPRGIARVCRWKDKGVVPRWEEVSESVESMAALSVRDVRSFLRDLGPRVEELGAIMRACGVPKDILTKRESAIDQVARSLLALKG
jgi:serine/threonine-protein kinase HipA